MLKRNDDAFWNTYCYVGRVCFLKLMNLYHVSFVCHMYPQPGVVFKPKAVDRPQAFCPFVLLRRAIFRSKYDLISIIAFDTHSADDQFEPARRFGYFIFLRLA